MKKNVIMHPDGSGNAFLNVKNDVFASIKIVSSTEMFANPDADPKTVPLKKYRGYVPWGENDDLPQQIISKVAKSPDMSTNMLFNISAGYGDGIFVVRRTVENGKIKLEPVFDNVEINEFFENNDINGYLSEQLTDLNYFYNTFTELILNQDTPEKRKVVEILHKEAAFSRWESMNPKTGIIENHFYSAKFYSGETINEGDIEATAVLRKKNPALDLLRRIGREPYPDLKKIDEKNYRYIVSAEFPTPGRFYYQKPYWYSLIESGWYDFAMLIPEFKKALLNNQMTIKYMVYINEKYFPAIFAEEGITDKEAQKDRIKKEYENIQGFLSGAKNSGKATIGKIKYSPDGKEEPMIKIIPIENHFKGGEYIEDSEEVSNILAYGMGVHASIIGSHGKNKSINGTEARELFIIKQAMLKPMRDRLLKPLYVVKKINKWPDDIHFVIPNMEIVTQDKDQTGHVTKAGNTEL